MAASMQIGVLGVIILIMAWIWETWENVKKKKIDLHMHFAAMYIAGNVLLTVYARMIQNAVFFWLGIALLVAIFVELAYSFAKK